MRVSQDVQPGQVLVAANVGCDPDAMRAAAEVLLAAAEEFADQADAIELECMSIRAAVEQLVEEAKHEIPN